MSEPAATTPPPFGDSYAKARKAYGLVSALLLAWELVGIEIDAKPIENLQISLKSPQAAPYVLIALVVYFAFHFTVEWHQAAPARRRLWASRLDFVAGHTIGGAALALYTVQALFRVQIADRIPGGAFAAFGVGFLAAAGFTAFMDIAIAIWPSFWLDRRRAKLLGAIILLAAFFALAALGYTVRVSTFLYFGLGYIGGFAVVSFEEFMRFRILRPRHGVDRAD